MKRIALAFLLAASTSAFAAEPAKPAPKPPTCGKTIEECQKQVDDLTTPLAQLRIAYQGVRNQRIAAQAAKDDADINAYVQQQSAAAAAGSKK